MNLIYACVFHQKSYIEMLELLLKSLKLKGSLDITTTDFLIYTQPDFEEDIRILGLSLDVPIKIELLDITSQLSNNNPRYSLFESARFKGHFKNDSKCTIHTFFVGNYNFNFLSV